MFRVFGLTGAFVLVVVAAAGVEVVFGVVVSDDAPAGAVVFVAAGTDPVELAALLTLPVAGVVVVVAGGVGSVVSGVGSGGNGFDITPAISSFRPASDLS